MPKYYLHILILILIPPYSNPQKASVTATPNAPELNTVTDPEVATGGKPRVLKDKRIRNLLTVAAVSCDTDTDAEAESRPGTPTAGAAAAALPPLPATA